MDAEGVTNDMRGWIMCVVSGIACIVGASVICVDLLVRLLPSKRDFRIQDSNAFLASSLSLSFGVMLFMSLYSMLPEAKSYLEKGGYSDQPAGFILMACFVGGFVGIQAISRLFHQFLPSHVVDCDHTHHDHGVDEHLHAGGHGRRQSSYAKIFDRRHSSVIWRQSTVAKSQVGANGRVSESTPLLPSTEHPHSGHVLGHESTDAVASEIQPLDGAVRPSVWRSRASIARRPSMAQVKDRVVSFVKDSKAYCDESGQCYGYSDPCGQECFKHISSRPEIAPRPSITLRTTTSLAHSYPENMPIAEGGDDRQTESPVSPGHGSRAPSCEQQEFEAGAGVWNLEQLEDVEAQHHHHVPENAFLSIGLQTSIAIALHKFPEGFITYATNHANPSLGFNVFLALAVHNISEGFAMALPLYMALHSRPKAIAWSSVLGGLSQPMGAGIAVLWFHLARRTHMTPDAVAYGCLFAVTAGIMASVALQLFVESLSLNHNRNLSIFFAFLGMTLLGVSNAFTSDAH
ncbi:hypothetical protein DL769_010212 [Monosporascus sp. CRB-8-3]|nr:hypothetical protein DL769_010212 [Monosporascus sp. CRB-8-3]